VVEQVLDRARDVTDRRGTPLGEDLAIGQSSGRRDELLLGAEVPQERLDRAAGADRDVLEPRTRGLRGGDHRRWLPVQGFTLEDVKQRLGHSSIVLRSNT
jgi:hypothetical protein